MSNMFGLFEDQFKSVNIGDPYVKPRVVDSKYKGKQMVSTVNNFNATAVKTFERGPYKRIFDGDPYITQAELDRKRWIERNKRSIGTSFKPSSPAKHGSGAGSFYGSFTRNIEHMPEFEVLQKGDPRAMELAKSNSPRNFYTNPGKHVGPGVADRGMLLPKEERHDYKPSVYTTAEEENREYEKKQRAKILSGAFRVGIPKDEIAPGATISLPPVNSPRVSPRKAAASESTKSPKGDGKLKPFMPNSFNVEDPLNKFPAYEGSPYTLGDEVRKKEREDEKAKRIATRDFVPVSGPKSMYTRPLNPNSPRNSPRNNAKLQPLYAPTLA